ncbi:MAG: hypothetical protein H7Y08_01680 [Rhizobiaceae bacterium]|nr:hypothetical protein [Rhizobiaceae bacterium]
MMSAMEESLRRALEAGDTSDPAFRESIYAASERALERLLTSKQTDADAAHAQRVRLAETINRVEEDYYAPAPAEETLESYHDDEEQAGYLGHAGPNADPDENLTSADVEGAFIPAGHEPDDTSSRDLRAIDGDDPDRPFGDPDPEPPSSARRNEEHEDFRNPLPGAVPIAEAPGESAARDASWSPGGAKRGGAKPGRGRPFLFGTIVLLVTLIAGLVFAYVTIFAAPNAGVAPSDAAAPEGAEIAPVVEPAEIAWITLFDGTQLEMIATPTGGEVSAITGPGDRPAVRLAAAGEDGEIDVAIGPGVVNGIKGRTVRVEVTVGSPDGTVREFTVRCLFGGDTVCGRQRFSTVQDGEAFVFDMTVPEDPAASGAIAINPSFGTVANAIDLYSVRLRIVEGI